MGWSCVETLFFLAWLNMKMNLCFLRDLNTFSPTTAQDASFDASSQPLSLVSKALLSKADTEVTQALHKKRIVKDTLQPQSMCRNHPSNSGGWSLSTLALGRRTICGILTGDALCVRLGFRFGGRHVWLQVFHNLKASLVQGAHLTQLEGQRRQRDCPTLCAAHPRLAEGSPLPHLPILPTFRAFLGTWC